MAWIWMKPEMSSFAICLGNSRWPWLDQDFKYLIRCNNRNQGQLKFLREKIRDLGSRRIVTSARGSIAEGGKVGGWKQVRLCSYQLVFRRGAAKRDGCQA